MHAWVAGLKPEAMRTSIGFGGASNTRVSLPAGQFQNGADSLQWQPLQASLRIDGARTSMSYQFDVPEITLDFAVRQGAAGSIKLVNLHGQITGASAWGMPMGNGAGTFTLEQMQVVVPSGVQFDLNQLNYTVHSQVESDLGLTAPRRSKYSKRSAHNWAA